MNRVMVVEDNIDFRQTLCGALHKNMPDIFICEVANGQRAIQIADEVSPHIVLMDIALPLMNGLEVTRNLKRSADDPRIIIITGNDLPEYVEAAQTAGADYFLSKNSIKLAEITSLVRDILSSAETLPLKWNKFRIS